MCINISNLYVDIMPLRYYTQADYDAIEIADTCTVLLPLAMKILGRMKAAKCHDIIQVCGPISTGGKGSVAENIAAIDTAICELVERGHSVFNQMPFEGAMERVHKKWQAEGRTTYCQPILDDFYLPILKSGLVRTLAFLPGWQTSTGAQWEHLQAKELGILIAYL